MSSHKMTRQACTNTVSSLKDITVTRSKPELVCPSKPTPRELKQLSNIDVRERLRLLFPMIKFYRYNPSMEGKDPAKVIRDALANALVFYYPLAGRLIEGPDQKLFVDCTGEGVQFVEADADVELAQLGDPPRPPFPWLERFLYNVPVSGGILNSPLFFIQVTRLKCGGFVFAFRMNHVMSDAMGLVQFLTAVGEIGRGAQAPSITPIWCRELFADQDSRLGLSKSCPDKKVERPTTILPFNDIHMIQCSFYFGPSKMLAIRRLVPDHLRSSTTMFDILTVCVWRCRTVALQFDPEDRVQLMFSVNARDKTNLVVPIGYYGNAGAATGVETSARLLCEGPIEYALGLVKKAKEKGTKECMSWRTKPPAVVDQPSHSLAKCFVVTDTRRAGFGDVDFGWGKAAYAGQAKVEFDQVSFYVPFRNHNREDGVLLLLCLEAKAKERFETELNNLLCHKSTYMHTNSRLKLSCL